MDTSLLERDGYSISTDKSKLDVDVIHDYLSTQTYWNEGVPRNIVQRYIEHSLTFGVYHHDQQAGFCRIISDYTTFAYLADVFILPAHRGKGLSKWLMQRVMNHPDLQGLRRWMLMTRDAHALYEQFGWKVMAMPERCMEITVKDIYKVNTSE
jgi:GNAT superfamily N-acetyltransferase